MFIVTNNTKLQAAKIKASETRPFVSAVEFGLYEVEGSAGNSYQVRIQRFGQRTGVDCGCTAGVYGHECYHAAAALARHETLAASGALPAHRRDRNLSLVERDLRYIARRAESLTAGLDAADEILMAVRSALQSLGEYEDSRLPEMSEDSMVA